MYRMKFNQPLVHNGVRYAPGEEIPVTDAEYTQLKAYRPKSAEQEEDAPGEPNETGENKGKSKNK